MSAYSAGRKFNSSEDVDLYYNQMGDGNIGSPRDTTYAAPSSAKKKKYHRRSDSGSSSSFSQSKEFQSIFDDDGKRKNEDDDDATEVYVVKQKFAYFSILFSLAQTIILLVMMIQCGVAPININPMCGPYPDALSEWGGKNAINILEDREWWRLITPIMLHAGVIHLLCNVAVQMEAGAFYEREWGSLNWLIIYLTSAVGSSILSVIVMPNAVSVGSSGAVMGLFGGKLSEYFCRFCESSKTEQGRVGHKVRNEQCCVSVCSVTVVMLFSFIPYVDWAAHLGGLLAGICAGMMIFSCSIKTMVYRLLWFIVGIVITVAYFVATLKEMYSGDVEVIEELRDVCGYYKENFENYECNCMRDEHGGEK